MTNEGFDGVKIGKAINRGRATVCKYKTKIKHELPIYKATRDKYEKIIKTIETIKNENKWIQKQKKKSTSPSFQLKS